MSRNDIYIYLYGILKHLLTFFRGETPIFDERSVYFFLNHSILMLIRSGIAS